MRERWCFGGRSQERRGVAAVPWKSIALGFGICSLLSFQDFGERGRFEQVFGSSLPSFGDFGVTMHSASCGLRDQARFCHLPVCEFHNADAPRLFVDQHVDGCGHRLWNMISGMAVAARSGMNFGGAMCNSPSDMYPHNHNFSSLVDNVFGRRASTNIFVSRELRMDAKLDSVEALERVLPFPSSYKVYLPAAQGWDESVAPAESYFTPIFRAAILAPLASWPLDFVQGRPSVAVHLRRGDLETTDSRATPDGYYYGLGERLRGILPTADFHVFSSIKDPYREAWTVSDFEGYRARNMTVHLDDEDLMVPLTHLARATVLLMAQSSLSAVAALMNPHCVIVPGPFYLKRLPNWIVGPQASNADIASCITKWR